MAIDNTNSTTPQQEKDFAQTPPWFMESLQKHLGVEFELDVCAQEQTAKAEAYFSLEEGDDALEINWGEAWKEAMETDEMPWAYCNPPFSDMLTWIDKVIEQVKEHGMPVVMMVPNNPETEYVRKAKDYATKIIEMPFRLKFLRPNGEKFMDKEGKRENSPKFSCLIAVFTKEGLMKYPQYYYHDFRKFDERD